MFREALSHLHILIQRLRITPPPIPYEIVTFRKNCMMLNKVCLTVTTNLLGYRGYGCRNSDFSSVLPTTEDFRGMNLLLRSVTTKIMHLF